MTLCDDGHDEICHEGRSCPLCEKLAVIDRPERDKDDLNTQIADMEREATRIDKELQAARAQLERNNL